MNKLHHIFLIFSLLILSNCTPARINNDIQYNQSSEKVGKVQIQREKKLVYWGVHTVFGYDGKDKVTLSNGQKKEIYLPAGEHEFFIRTNQADRPNQKTFRVNEGDTLCLTTKPSRDSLIKSLFFTPLFWFTSAFTLESAESCK